MARLGPMITENPFTGPERNVIVCDDEDQAKELIKLWEESNRAKAKAALIAAVQDTSK